MSCDEDGNNKITYSADDYYDDHKLPTETHANEVAGTAGRNRDQGERSM